MRKLVIALGLLVLVAAGWSGLWLWTARQAGTQVDLWLAAEAAQGRIWRCPSRALGGYPFAVTLSCEKPSFAGEAMGKAVEAQLARLTGEITLWHPHRVALILTPPFGYKTSDNATNLGGTWHELALELDGLPSLEEVTLHGTKVAVAGSFGDQGRQAGSATRLDARITPPADPANPTLGFAIAVDGAPIAALDELVGDQAPADVALEGTLEHADVGDARTPEEALENWRAVGGRVALDSGSIVREQAKATASGSLALDAQHRAQGKLDTQLVGLEPILARYGISGNLAAAGSLLSTLFGGGRQAAPVQPGALALPITLRNGRVRIGPITTSLALPPLY